MTQQQQFNAFKRMVRWFHDCGMEYEDMIDQVDAVQDEDSNEVKDLLDEILKQEV